MKKGEVHTGTVREVKYPNRGLVRLSGAEEEEGRHGDGSETCVVKNVLPGQEVSFVVTKKRNGRAEGKLLKVLAASPLETGESCPHFGSCGGCSYLSLPYETQLAIKQRQLTEILSPVLGDRFFSAYEGIKASPSPFEYRNKMEFSFGNERKDGPLVLGLHRRESFYDVVPADGCRIVDGDYRSIRAFTQEYFASRGVDFYHGSSHVGYLRHLLIRKAAHTGEILVALVTTTQRDMDLTAWANGLLSLSLSGKISGILHILNDSASDAIKNDETRLLYGTGRIEERLLGLRFEITPFSFFQTNSRGAETLYETVRDFVTDRGLPGAACADTPRVIYDLYCGTGTIAQLLSPLATKVVGVEIMPEAAEAARGNAARNGLSNCTFLTGDVLRILDGIQERPELIVLDPPREGIHPKALAKLLSYQVKRVIYVSCKPTSLARDLEVFLRHGYAARRIAAVDQFPWTANIETVCLLIREAEEA